MLLGGVQINSPPLKILNEESTGVGDPPDGLIRSVPPARTWSTRNLRSVASVPSSRSFAFRAVINSLNVKTLSVFRDALNDAVAFKVGGWFTASILTLTATAGSLESSRLSNALILNAPCTPDTVLAGVQVSHSPGPTVKLGLIRPVAVTVRDP